MRLLPIFSAGLLLLSCQYAFAGQKSVTYYLDGARIEEEAAAVKGYLEYQLPDSLEQGSLRVKPVGEGKVLRVELLPAERDQRHAREIAKLEARKRELKDRMEDLSRRESLFSAAVKSQSGKSPRKTRANPDPVASLKQGTEFALGQLESVYRSQRRCQRDIEELERKLASARKGATVARIWLSSRRARISYQVTSLRWTPSYDFRWDGEGKGELLLHARLPRPEKGVLRLVSGGKVAEGEKARAVREEFPVLSRYPLEMKSSGRTDQRPLSFTFAPVAAALPAGDASAFWRGEYLGSGRFSGGGASEISIGGE